MKSIWFFVGLTLSIMGVLVVVAGIHDVVAPPARQTVLSGLHPALWWGVLMIVAGVTFLIREKKQH
jgi:hypothetical protein